MKTSDVGLAQEALSALADLPVGLERMRMADRCLD